jgi:hypothetical protein
MHPSPHLTHPSPHLTLFVANAQYIAMRTPEPPLIN